jgi:hypothetical protein
MRPIFKSLSSAREPSGPATSPHRPAAATTVTYSQRELVRWSLLVCPEPDKGRS